MTSTHFFAAKANLTPGIQLIESGKKLQYVLCGLFESPDIVRYRTLLDAPGLGFSTTGDHIAGDRYLVLDKSRTVQVETIPQRSGELRYAIDQNLNSGSTTILPGGMFENRLSDL